MKYRLLGTGVSIYSEEIGFAKNPVLIVSGTRRGKTIATLTYLTFSYLILIISIIIIGYKMILICELISKSNIETVSLIKQSFKHRDLWKNCGRCKGKPLAAWKRGIVKTGNVVPVKPEPDSGSGIIGEYGMGRTKEFYYEKNCSCSLGSFRGLRRCVPRTFGRKTDPDGSKNRPYG
jgi:hypothetical protein